MTEDIIRYKRTLGDRSVIPDPPGLEFAFFIESVTVIMIRTPVKCSRLPYRIHPGTIRMADEEPF